VAQLCVNLRSLPAEAAASCPLDQGTIQLEAAGCVLASQVPHEMAVAALSRLRLSGLLPCAHRRPSDQWEHAVAFALSSPLSDDYRRCYRFPAAAAGRLATLVWVTPMVSEVLGTKGDPRVVRRSLVDLRCGLGPKQASLFLRNVGYSGELAVLDVHLLAFMRLTELTDATRVPSGLRLYEQLEDKLRNYAIGYGEPLGRLDLAIWVTMRAARAEERACLR
jgi:N-glycosylase/DNA lyase